MTEPTKQQMLDLLKGRFGDVELVCEHPVFIGSQTMLPLSKAGILVVYQDENEKKFAVQIPIGLCLTVQKEAA